MAEQDRLGLHNLRPEEGARKTAKRRGRGHGSGSGKTSGRGHKGQGSRSGGGVPHWFEGGQMPLYRRTPKRGFKPISRVEYRAVNLRSLAGLEENEIDPSVMHGHGLIGSLRERVKVLGVGDLERAVAVRAHAFSATAKAKIEAAGGSAEVIG